MAKGPIITSAVEQLIIKVYLRKPTSLAKKIREEVNDRLRKNDPSIAPEWPSLSSVQKVLARIHKKERELPRDPEDRPWSVSNLTQYPIPPETLPAVLRAWADALHRGAPLTIREVRWAARLYYVIKESGYLDAGLLSTMARKYAFAEKTASFVTAKVHITDRQEEDKLWVLWRDDAILCHFMTRDERPLRKVVKEMKCRMPHMLEDEEDWDEEKRCGIEALFKTIESW
jgi:hypothetical protein